MTDAPPDYGLGRVTAAVGQKNSGKSIQVEHALTEMERYVVLDPKHDHFPPNSVAVESPDELRRAWSQGYHRVVVRDPPLTAEKFRAYLRVVLQVVEDAFVVIDEAGRYMDANSVPEELKVLAQDHVSHGNVGLVVALQFMSDIHSKVFQQVDTFILYSYGRMDDAKLRRVLDAEGQQALDELRFDRYEYLVVHERGLELRPRVPLPGHLGAD